MTWISVKDRLPEREKPVLAGNDAMKCVAAGVRMNLTYWRAHISGGSLGFPVTHWQPLPEAPRPEPKRVEWQIVYNELMGRWVKKYPDGVMIDFEEYETCRNPQKFEVEINDCLECGPQAKWRTDPSNWRMYLEEPKHQYAEC